MTDVYWSLIAPEPSSLDKSVSHLESVWVTNLDRLCGVPSLWASLELVVISRLPCSRVCGQRSVGPLRRASYSGAAGLAGVCQPEGKRGRASKVEAILCDPITEGPSIALPCSFPGNESTLEGGGEQSVGSGRRGHGEPRWHLQMSSVYVMDKIRNEKELF